MRPFVVLALNVVVGSIGFWVGGFTGGTILAALVVADCMAVVAEGRAWAREDAADALWDDEPAGQVVNLDGSPARLRVYDWKDELGREGRAG